MTILTYPMFPVPIWGGLQICNHLLQHRWIATGEALDLETLVAGQRFLGAGEVYARWPMPSGTGRRFGGLTGDYNGIHR